MTTTQTAPLSGQTVVHNRTEITVDRVERIGDMLVIHGTIAGTAAACHFRIPAQTSGE